MAETYYARLNPLDRAALVWRSNEKREVRRQKYLRIVNRYKACKGCADCGVKGLPGFVYDLDHIDPSQKVAGVGEMIGWVRPWKIIREEIKKCEVVCANCHRIRTHG